MTASPPRHRPLAAALAAFLLQAAPIAAAEVTSDRNPDGSGLVRLAGVILPGDDAKIAAALAREPRPRGIALASLGGNVEAALAIGTIVRKEGLRTSVAAHGICASACGLVWLAGTTRVLGPEAHVGLHAAYLRRHGVDVETGAANALIGAYLGRLGFGDRAIVYLTSAAPDEMTWILPVDRQRYGIAFEAAAAPAVAVVAPQAEDHFLSRPMALAGAIASAAVAAVDRLLGSHAAASADR